MNKRNKIKTKEYFGRKTRSEQPDKKMRQCFFQKTVKGFKSKRHI
jgi:hypothetical protein